ncbi:Coenzyme F420 hydrogenase/dehydrogenase, beta subunit C-terminal domain [Desulfovirgula thermocuniculi]|uniref:Coenzyme F420 hydrogenase/dehydrogenase, beta subunit C-terminal domain n=1 Tax=Desulfovirgula thermocuniculi TaxID=348842 RepID=UPI0012EC4DF9|nr:Coenzyme F420 hydrogenase/dehydrogenase, beta subunit C-terminal domain [Desulfovirgula thermocuniculi]
MPGGPGDLLRQVLQTGQCVSCGLCLDLCPYLQAAAERVVMIHHCGLEEGNCFRVCPRTPTDWEEMDRRVFGAPRADHVLGHYRQILFARATDPVVAAAGQYGGVVSALIIFALDGGKIRGAVLTAGAPGEMPQPALAVSPDEVLACAGSKYSAAPSLRALHEAARRGVEPVAVVGRPCQVLAVRKLQAVQGIEAHHLAGRKVALVVGLFCFWALEPGFHAFLRAVAGKARILKVDFSPESMLVRTDRGPLCKPVEEVRGFIRPACRECFDPTAEFADVAVGSTEYDEAWNTLVIRSKRGEALVRAALEAGAIEVRPYPPERLPALRAAVRSKKLRALEVQASRGESSYLLIPAGYRQALTGRDQR